MFCDGMVPVPLMGVKGVMPLGIFTLQLYIVLAMEPEGVTAVVGSPEHIV
jgi:hypothetical protein